MKNPFTIRELPLDGPFCNREKELRELSRHALNHMNVVLYSHRRFGKTSLAKRVMDSVGKKGMISIYVDLIGVTGIEDISGRIAARTYAYTSKTESIFKRVRNFLTMWQPVFRPDPKSGLKVSVEMVGTPKETLLEDTLKALKGFSEQEKKGCLIVLDEFQEITGLPDDLSIEGRMRSQIQQHDKISYLFVGSKRRVLSDMFQNKDRAFYRSALLYQLNPIRSDVFAAFVRHQFESNGKSCDKKAAAEIVESVEAYPYYVQKLAYLIYENSAAKLKQSDVALGLNLLLESERVVFETMLQPLSTVQRALLIALAQQPAKSVLSSSYMRKHLLSSIGGVQAALLKLSELDYVEETNGYLRVVDPVFALYLKSLSYL